MRTQELEQLTETKKVERDWFPSELPGMNYMIDIRGIQDEALNKL